jgi:hypothetical protein
MRSRPRSYDFCPAFFAISLMAALAYHRSAMKRSGIRLVMEHAALSAIRAAGCVGMFALACCGGWAETPTLTATNGVATTNTVVITNTASTVAATATNGIEPAISPELISTNNPMPQIAPPASWVKPQFFNPQSTFGAYASGADDQILLLERQVNAADNEIFVHSVRRILTLGGVQKLSTLTTDFSPSYQTLTLHWARLWRGTQHIEELDANRLRVVQPEQEMDQFILNGRKSTILVLDDVRVGDVIDYAYSIKGQNPVLMGHMAIDVPVQLEQPADHLLTRVLWPPDRRLYSLPHGCSVQPAVIKGKESVEYRWDLHQIPGLALEDNLPAWYDPGPWIQLSEFKSWADVDQWALHLFQGTAPFSPELSRLVATWKKVDGQENQVLAVLRFVQDQIRYFGIEIGVSAEKPGDPSTVLAHRFGDCKDKSRLFVAALRALGIEAYPVLVNSTMGRGIAGWWPSASIFDHCIAVVRVNGQTYWLDPTMTYQRGPLGAHYLPDYGCGLVITPGTAALTAIPHTTGLPRTTVREYFQLWNAHEPCDLKVVTIAEGSDAEALRALFAQSKRADIEKHYTHFYSDLYPGIRMTSPVAFEDDEQNNKVQTTELYSIDRAWTAAGAGSYRCEFYPATLGDCLKKPVDTVRRFPLGMDYPKYEFVHTEVILPAAWPADAGKESVADGAFSFQKAFQREGNKLVMEYEYKSLADSVAPDRMAAYLEHVNKCSEALGYSLIWR